VDPSVVLAGVIFGGAVLFAVFAADLLLDRQLDGGGVPQS
jgi:hypothetical protein